MTNVEEEGITMKLLIRQIRQCPDCKTWRDSIGNGFQFEKHGEQYKGSREQWVHKTKWGKTIHLRAIKERIS
jgi:hypothetical protein